MMRKHYLAMILLMLCISNMHGQVVVPLPFYDGFNNYIPDSVRQIDATHYYLSAYHIFGGWEVCTRGYVLSTNCTTSGPSHHNNPRDGKVRMDYASAYGDYMVDTTYDYRCGGTLLASPWFYELPNRVTFEFIVPRQIDLPNNTTLPLEIELGVLTDTIPDITTMGGVAANQSVWPYSPTCGRDFIPFATRTYTYDSNRWQAFDVNVLGMFDGVLPPYRIAFRTRCCDTSYVMPASNSTYIDDIQIYPAHNTTYDTFYIADTVCLGETYGRNGFNVSQTDTLGTFSYVSVAATGDSSVAVRFLQLTVQTGGDTMLYDTIFVGGSLAVFDTVLTDSGTYTFIIRAANGCDSTVVMCLHTILLTDTVTIYDTTCVGVQYDHYGYNLQPDQPGLYIHERDSVEELVHVHYRLILTVRPTYTSEDHITIAPGDTIYYEGMAITDRGVYEIQLTDRYGCDSTIILYVRLDNTQPERPEEYCSIWFPNIFTPGKETNNRFCGHVNCKLKSYKMTIFDRCGTFLFGTTDVEECWDGTAKGQALPQGAYVYKYEIHTMDGLFYSRMGAITLIR